MLFTYKLHNVLDESKPWNIFSDRCVIVLSVNRIEMNDKQHVHEYMM